MSPFWDTLDFNYHQTGLNGHQLILDEDNCFRCVIAFEDPGIANWLDPMGLPQGQCLFRWYDGKPFSLPKTKLVKHSDIEKHLPKNTARVTALERKDNLSQRARASLGRWGY